MVFLKGGSCHWAAFHKNPPVSSLENRSGWKELGFCVFSHGCNVIFFFFSHFYFFSLCYNLFNFVLTWNYDRELFEEWYRMENIYSHCLYRLCFNYFAPRHFQEQHRPSSTTNLFFFPLFFLKVQGSIPQPLHKHKPHWRQWEFFRGEDWAPWPAAINTLGLSLLMDGI